MEQVTARNGPSALFRHRNDRSYSTNCSTQKTLQDCVLGFFDFVVQFRSDFLQIRNPRLGITISSLWNDCSRSRSDRGNVASGISGDHATSFMDRANRSRELLHGGLHARTEDSAAKHVFAALGWA